MLRAVILAVAAVAGLALACPVQAANVGPLKCKEVSTARKPTPGDETWTLQGPNGPVTLRIAKQVSECSQKYFEQTRTSTKTRYGLIDSAGKLLVPAEYAQVLPLSSTSAAVRQLGAYVGAPYLPWRLYRFGKGEEAATWTGGAGVLRQYLPGHAGPVVPYAYDTPDGNNRATFYLFGDGTKAPVALASVGGPTVGQVGLTPKVRYLEQSEWEIAQVPVERFGDTIVAHLTTEDGVPVNRLLDNAGTVISPVLPRIERWHLWSSEAALAYRIGPDARVPLRTRADGGVPQLVARAFPANHPDLPYEHLYLPINAKGEPLPLPEGVVGVFPLKMSLLADAGTIAMGWGVVYRTPDGVRIRRGQAPLAEILARPDAFPISAGLNYFYNPDFSLGTENAAAQAFVEKDVRTGLWRVLDPITLQPKPLGVGMEARTAEEASTLVYTAIMNKWAADTQRNIALSQEEKRKRDLANAAELKQLIATGQLCRDAFRTANLGRDALIALLQSCNITDPYSLERARGANLDPALIARVNGAVDLASRQAYADMQRQQQQAAAYIAANPKFNWEAYGDAAVRGIQANGDAWAAGQRKTYYENLERWNRGAQNWGGPKN